MKISVKFLKPIAAVKRAALRALSALVVRRIDVILVLVMGVLLFLGASWQITRIHTDAARYECYAVAFWQGVPALHRFPTEQCLFLTHPALTYLTTQDVVTGMRQMELPQPLIQFVAVQNSTQAFHALPHEYPMLTLIPFSLPLVVPPYWYQIVFALWMAAVAATIYCLLLRYRSRGVALLCAFYLIVGGWGTAEGRFDLIPSALTLLAVIAATRKHWYWAFTYLALGVLFKLYPFILLFPFLIAQQMDSRERWYSWRRLLPLATFVGVCAGVSLVSLLLSVEGTLAPLSYFATRPFQIESASASVLWLFSFLGFQLRPVYSYGSLNVLSPLSPIVDIGGSVLLLAGLAFTYWLQLRRKLDLAASCLLTLLIVIFTGKVFSPQYLIWVAPLVAYVAGPHLKWLLTWGALSGLTTFIYPYIYNMGTGLMDVPNVPIFYPMVAIRNLLLLICIILLLRSYARQCTVQAVSFVSPEDALKAPVAAK
jgi:hypothetical protein